MARFFSVSGFWHAAICPLTTPRISTRHVPPSHLFPLEALPPGMQTTCSTPQDVYLCCTHCRTHSKQMPDKGSDHRALPYASGLTVNVASSEKPSGPHQGRNYFSLLLLYHLVLGSPGVLVTTWGPPQSTAGFRPGPHSTLSSSLRAGITPSLALPSCQVSHT